MLLPFCKQSCWACHHLGPRCSWTSWRAEVETGSSGRAPSVPQPLRQVQSSPRGSTAAAPLPSPSPLLPPAVAAAAAVPQPSLPYSRLPRVLNYPLFFVFSSLFPTVLPPESRERKRERNKVINWTIELSIGLQSPMSLYFLVFCQQPQDGCNGGIINSPTFLCYPFYATPSRPPSHETEVKGE